MKRAESLPFGGDPTVVRVAPGSGGNPVVVATLASVTSQPMGLAVAPVRLVAGRRYPLRVEYYQQKYDAVVRLMWQVPGRAAAEVIVEAIGRHGRPEGAAEGERALQRAYELLPGLGEPVPVRVEDTSPVVGMHLAELGLRGRTGATIIAISRGPDVVLVPDGHERLRAGDVVALAGTREAIAGARHLLRHGRSG